MAESKFFISDDLFDEMLEEMSRRINQPKHINISADGYEADGNSDWLPTYDTQVGVEFAVEFLNKRLSHASLTEELDRLREVLVDAEDFFNGGENHNCPTHQRIIAAIGDAKGGAS